MVRLLCETQISTVKGNVPPSYLASMLAE